MKKLLLFSFLAINTITHCVLDVNLHIQKLNEAQLKKVQELSDISVQIAQKQALIEAWSQQLERLFCAGKETCALSEESIANFVQKFEKALCEKKDARGVLVEGFSADTESYEAAFVKVYLVRRYFERLLVKNLFERYEKCLQEFIEIGRYVETLSK